MCLLYLGCGGCSKIKVEGGLCPAERCEQEVASGTRGLGILWGLATPERQLRGSAGLLRAQHRLLPPCAFTRCLLVMTLTTQTPARGPSTCSCPLS